MKSAIYCYKGSTWEKNKNTAAVPVKDAQLVLCFANKSILEAAAFYPELKTKFPEALIVTCSTAGEICHRTVSDHGAVAAVLQFDHTRLRKASVNIGDYHNSYDAATALVQQLPSEGLVYLLVFSDGSLVNGSELVKGLKAAAPEVPITGGLAGDGADFNGTLVGIDQQPAAGNIVAIGFYGDKIKIAHGSQGGWDVFGLEKEITRSSGNVLFDINGVNALSIYKQYLGPDAEQLPRSALLFPIAVTIPGETKPVVRTILSIDENNQSMTFAGDVPEGSRIRFMRANFDTLTLAAAAAAGNIMKEGIQPGFALLISCVGRKLILGPRTEEEVEAVCDTLGAEVPAAGFYSYGEISPFNEGGACQLHNQTMTITSFYEIP